MNANKREWGGETNPGNPAGRSNGLMEATDGQVPPADLAAVEENAGSQ